MRPNPRRLPRTDLASPGSWTTCFHSLAVVFLGCNLLEIVGTLLSLKHPVSVSQAKEFGLTILAAIVIKEIQFKITFDPEPCETLKQRNMNGQI